MCWGHKGSFFELIGGKLYHLFPKKEVGIKEAG